MSNILSNINKKILVIGRAGMDVYPEPPGTKTEDVESFSTHLGGSAANTCVSLHRYGIQTDIVTCISNDSIGNYVKKKLSYFIAKNKKRFYQFKIRQSPQKFCFCYMSSICRILNYIISTQY